MLLNTETVGVGVLPDPEVVVTPAGAAIRRYEGEEMTEEERDALLRGITATLGEQGERLEGIEAKVERIEGMGSGEPGAAQEASASVCSSRERAMSTGRPASK